MILLYR